jgi:CBS domain-containing protein/RNA polymerase-binding transcription factor DksA
MARKLQRFRREPMDLPVKSWMSGDPVAVEPFASALEAHGLMVDHGIRHLAVVDAAHRVVGVLSIDDLRAALPFPVSTGEQPSPAERTLAQGARVSDLMRYAPETIHEDTPLSEAAQQMADRRIGCLPIVDEQGRLAGMLSETDVLHALVTRLWTDRVRERRSKAAEFDLLVEDLKREREEIAQRLDRYHAVEREVSADLQDRPLDLAERGAGLREVEITESLDELAIRRLEAIDRALDHANQGRLGTCDRCGGRIGVGRLRALPGITRCAACVREGTG